MNHRHCRPLNHLDFLLGLFVASFLTFLSFFFLANNILFFALSAGDTLGTGGRTSCVVAGAGFGGLTGSAAKLDAIITDVAIKLNSNFIFFPLLMIYIQRLRHHIR
jgi:hypothetical protein